MNKVLAGIGVIFLLFFSGILIKDVVNPPEITKIEIPKFNGQILPAQEVNHQIFSIQKDFSEIGSWGKEAILTFSIDKSEGYRHYERFVFEAWRPDPQTPNIFQYASKKIDLLGWTVPSVIYTTAEISKKGNTLYVAPKKTYLNLKVVLILMSILAFLILSLYALDKS